MLARTERSATAPTKIKHADSIQQVSRSELDRSPKLCAEAQPKPFVVASQDLVLSVTQSILLELSLRPESRTETPQKTFDSLELVLIVSTLSLA